MGRRAEWEWGGALVGAFGDVRREGRVLPQTGVLPDCGIRLAMASDSK